MNIISVDWKLSKDKNNIYLYCYLDGKFKKIYIRYKPILRCIFNINYSTKEIKNIVEYFYTKYDILSYGKLPGDSSIYEIKFNNMYELNIFIKYVKKNYNIEFKYDKNLISFFREMGINPYSELTIETFDILKKENIVVNNIKNADFSINDDIYDNLYLFIFKDKMFFEDYIIRDDNCDYVILMFDSNANDSLKIYNMSDIKNIIKILKNKTTFNNLIYFDNNYLTNKLKKIHNLRKIDISKYLSIINNKNITSKHFLKKILKIDKFKNNKQYIQNFIEHLILYINNNDIIKKYIKIHNIYKTTFNDTKMSLNLYNDKIYNDFVSFKYGIHYYLYKYKLSDILHYNNDLFVYDEDHYYYKLYINGNLDNMIKHKNILNEETIAYMNNNIIYTYKKYDNIEYKNILFICKSNEYIIIYYEDGKYNVKNIGTFNCKFLNKNIIKKILNIDVKFDNKDFLIKTVIHKDEFYETKSHRQLLINNFKLLIKNIKGNTYKVKYYVTTKGPVIKQLYNSDKRFENYEIDFEYYIGKVEKKIKKFNF